MCYIKIIQSLKVGYFSNYKNLKQTISLLTSSGFIIQLVLISSAKKKKKKKKGILWYSKNISK